MNRRLKLTLAGLLATSTTSFADTPFKGGPSAFGSNSNKTTTTPSTKTEPPVITKVESTPPTLRTQDSALKTAPKQDSALRTASLSTENSALSTSYSLRTQDSGLRTNIVAACIEVAWLQDPATYQLRLRADATGNAIVLTGFLPTDRLREKAIAIAQRNAGTATIIDQLVIHAPMALPAYVATDAEQKLLIEVALEAATPGLSSKLQITVDAQGIATVSGVVQELQDRRKIIRGLQAIPGCQAIRYGLTVPAPSRVQMASATNSSSAVPALNLDVMAETRPGTSEVPSVVLSPVTPPPMKASSTTTTVPTPAPVTPVYPTLPAPSINPSQSKAPDLVVPTEQKPTPVRNMVTTSSLSGLFPPGATLEEPPMVLGSMLGQPVVRVQHTINLDVMTASPSAKFVVTKPLVVTDSITRSVDVVPVQAMMPVEDISAPALIPVMPRLTPSK